MFATYEAPLQKDIFVEVLLSPVNRHPFVRAVFSLNRFSNLLNYLSFDDKLDLHGVKEVYFAPSVTCGMPPTQN